MNAPHEEAVEFAKQSKRENRVYVGNLSYDVKYRDLIEFMRGGGWGNLSLVSRNLQLAGRRGQRAVSVSEESCDARAPWSVGVSWFIDGVAS